MSKAPAVNNSVPDVALKSYESARDEMLMRIRERELAMYIWLGAIGTIMTVAFKGTTPENHKVLLILPILALGIAMRINQHEMLIAALASYCKNEIGPLLKEGCPSTLCHWDESDALRQRQEWIVILRIVITFALLVFPSVVALFYNYPFKASHSVAFCSAWVVGVVATAIVAFLELESLLARLAALMRPA